MSSSTTMETQDILPRGGIMAWLVCLSAGLFFFYEFFQLNIFDVINQPLREDFNLNASQLSWMSSSFLWADILFLLPAGIILDRFSTRRVIFVALLVCVIGTVGFALTNSYAMASFYHFLSGIGNSFCFLACVVLVSRWFPPQRQALVIGLVVTMAFIGGMMAHTPFAYLNTNYGWRNSLLIDGAVGVFLLVWVHFMVKDNPANQVIKNTPNSPMLSGFMAVLINRQNWLAGFYTCFLNLPIMVLGALWGASYLQEVHHLPEIAASNTISLIFFGSIIGCPIAGWLSDTMGQRKPLMLAGALASLLCVLPLILDISLSETMLNILFFALGFFTSTQVISYPLIAESNSSSHTGTATGVASVLIMGGGGVGQVLFGWLIEHSSVTMQQYTAADFQYAMGLFPLTVIAAIIAVLLTRETYCKPKK